MKDKTEKAKYDIEYAKVNLKRVPLDMQITEYEHLKKVAAGQGEKINEFIKKAIRMRIKDIES